MYPRHSSGNSGFFNVIYIYIYKKEKKRKERKKESVREGFVLKNIITLKSFINKNPVLNPYIDFKDHLNTRNKI